MRASLGLGLLGAAGFFGVLAVVVPTYVLESLAVAPDDYYSVTRLRAVDATALDRSSGKTLTGVTVDAVSSLRGDANAATADLVVWDNFTTVQTADGAVTLSYTDRRVAFDKRTGTIVNCCGAYVGDAIGVEQSGLAFKWPFFAERKDYPFFDTVTSQALPMRYRGQEQVAGLTVYRYEQTVGTRRLGEVPGGRLPAAMLGLSGRGDVRAFVHASVERRYWVEPVTGTPVKIEERQRETVNTADGVPRLVALDADFRSPPEDVDARADQIRASVALLKAARGPAPWALGALAALSLVAGLVAIRSRRPVIQS
ncbi:DUF3068 domain-containing protein [Microtetraspora glauca]|uniref:DUF3068 domain-containing protein n=1 Tax=Microtetraspora glauca TaxID=1996 RepID=A0ABV3G765_MICGL